MVLSVTATECIRLYPFLTGSGTGDGTCSTKTRSYDYEIAVPPFLRLNRLTNPHLPMKRSHLWGFLFSLCLVVPFFILVVDDYILSWPCVFIVELLSFGLELTNKRENSI